MNEDFIRTVVRAALEDLVAARLAHGVNSSAYQLQLERSLGFVRGSLEEVLTAARQTLERGDQPGAD